VGRAGSRRVNRGPGTCGSSSDQSNSAGNAPAQAGSALGSPSRVPPAPPSTTHTKQGCRSRRRAAAPAQGSPCGWCPHLLVVLLCPWCCGNPPNLAAQRVALRRNPQHREHGQGGCCHVAMKPLWLIQKSKRRWSTTAWTISAAKNLHMRGLVYISERPQRTMIHAKIQRVSNNVTKSRRGLPTGAAPWPATATQSAGCGHVVHPPHPCTRLHLAAVPWNQHTA
jgi:hypothetical protein